MIFKKKPLIHLQVTFSDWLTLFIAPADVHEQLPHQLACHLVEGPSLGGDSSIFGAVVPPHLKAHSILLGWKGSQARLHTATCTTACIASMHTHAHTQMTHKHSSLPRNGCWISDMTHLSHTDVNNLLLKGPKLQTGWVFHLEEFNVCVCVFVWVWLRTRGCVKTMWAAK